MPSKLTKLAFVILAAVLTSSRTFAEATRVYDQDKHQSPVSEKRCGQECRDDNQCGRGNGDCFLCMNHTCAKYPMCAEKCHSDRDCVQAGFCWQCHEGKCYNPGYPKCGSACFEDQDCTGGPANCSLCNSGICGPPAYNLTCGGVCRKDSQCKSAETPDCGYCIGEYIGTGGPGVCNHSVCGSDCASSTGRPKDFCLDGSFAHGTLCWICSPFCIRGVCSYTCSALDAAKKNLLAAKNLTAIPPSSRGDPCLTNEDCYGATDNESRFCLRDLGCQPLLVADRDRTKILWP